MLGNWTETFECPRPAQEIILHLNISGLETGRCRYVPLCFWSTHPPWTTLPPHKQYCFGLPSVVWSLFLLSGICKCPFPCCWGASVPYKWFWMKHNSLDPTHEISGHKMLGIKTSTFCMIMTIHGCLASGVHLRPISGFGWNIYYLGSCWCILWTQDAWNQKWNIFFFFSPKRKRLIITT